MNERKYLYTFLENGDVPIDNNRAENAIRPFAVGRRYVLKNITDATGYSATQPTEQKASAALYSIISTAQANGLDAEKYLTEGSGVLCSAGIYAVFSSKRVIPITLERAGLMLTFHK